MQKLAGSRFDRRFAIATMAGGVAVTMLPLGIARAQGQGREAGADAAFRAAFAETAAGGLDVPARLGFLLPMAIVIDHDVPFPMNLGEYADHLAFHAAQWERLETELHELAVVSHGDTVIVSTFYNERGKPKGAGFRLRAGFCTAVCTRSPAEWRALSLHRAPLSGQILDASPS